MDNGKRMDNGKLVRMEKPTWDPPVLRFRIVRHGAMVGGGSTRGEIQAWKVDVDAATARVEEVGHRQIDSMAPRLEVKPGR